MQVAVKHRNGISTSYDIAKIREVVEWACRGIKNVKSVHLESVFDARLKSEINTREIQGNLIANALELTTPEEPNWRYVAGRLHIWSLWKDIKVLRSLNEITDIYSSSFTAIKDKLVQGIYKPELLKYYPIDLIEEACNWLNSSLDKDYDYAGAKLLTSRYLLPNELPQECFLVTSLLLAAGSIPDIGEHGAYILAKEIYDAISERKISLATPMLANLRRPDSSVTSCFVLNVDDNLTHIFKVLGDCAEISKQGGGIGICVSKIRAAGSWVNKRQNSSGGVVPWIKIFNDTALAVNQGGRRAGAITVALDIWHLDIESFLELQTEHGDQRQKAYDIFPQVVIPDEFMRRVERDDYWTLIDPYEVQQVFKYDLAELWGDDYNRAYAVIESDILGDRNLFDCSPGLTQQVKPRLTLYKRIKAKELFKVIMKCQLNKGLPYLAFKDTINRANPNKNLGYIPAVNLCTESFSNTSSAETHCCDLVSLNLANITEQELSEITKLAVTILDNSLDIAKPPIKEAQFHHEKYRVIGVGVMGLADWVAKNKFSYKSSKKEIGDLFEDISYYAYKASIDLAKTRGCFLAFHKSEYTKPLINCHNKTWYQINSKQFARWERLFDEVTEYGIRNSQVLAIAPNTSSSLIQGCTASILPTHSRIFFDKAEGSLPVAPPFIDEYFWFYEENKHLDQRVVIDTTAIIQKWIDTGVSMELVFNLATIKPKDIYDILFSAWKQNIKAVYYIRTVQKDSFESVQVEECSTCAN